MIISLLTGMVAVCGRPYPGEVSQGPIVRDYVRALNIRPYVSSAIEQELRDLRGTTGPTQQALLREESL